MKNLTTSIALTFSLLSNVYAQVPAIEWQKCFGGDSLEYTDAGSLVATADGGYIMTGTTMSNNGNVSGNHGAFDILVIKFDSIGNLEWQKCLGGSKWDICGPIIQTNDGGYVLCGSTSSDDGDVNINHGSSDYWVVKLDQTGSIVWQKTYGGTHDDHSYSIIQTNDGGYAVAGYSSSNDGDVTGHHGQWIYTDYWILKVDTVGNIEWQQSSGCEKTSFEDF